MLTQKEKKTDDTKTNLFMSKSLDCRVIFLLLKTKLITYFLR